MSAVLGALPKLDGFSPLPLGIMAPFMAYQSALMGYSFGLNYEYGKRTVKSMSNETFNSLTPEQLENFQAEHHNVQLQTFINEVPKTDAIQNLVLEKMIQLEKMKIKMIPDLIKAVIEGGLEGLFGITSTGQPIRTTSITPGESRRETVTLPPVTTPTIPVTPTTTGRRTDPREITFHVQEQLTEHITKQIKQLKIHLAKFEAQLRQLNPAQHFNTIKSVNASILSITRELEAQRKQLINVKAGRRPY